MTGPADGLLEIAFVAVMGMITASLVLTFIRMMRGPRLMDRVVALELTATLVVGVVAATSIASGTQVLLDVAIALALVAFIGAVAFARYAERAGRR